VAAFSPEHRFQASSAGLQMPQWSGTWRKLKILLTTAPVQLYCSVNYDVTKPVLIQADASSFVIGAVVMEDSEVIEYASRSLTRIERVSSILYARDVTRIFTLDRMSSYREIINRG